MCIVCVGTTRRFSVPLLLLSPLFLSSPGPCFQRASSLLFPLMVQIHRRFVGSSSPFLAQYSQLRSSSPQIGKAAKQRAAATLWRGMILPVYTSLLLPPRCGSDSLCLSCQSLLSCRSACFRGAAGGNRACVESSPLSLIAELHRERSPALFLSFTRLDSTSVAAPFLLFPPLPSLLFLSTSLLLPISPPPLAVATQSQNEQMRE